MKLCSHSQAPNFCTSDVWELIRTFVPHVTGHVFTYPCRVPWAHLSSANPCLEHETYIRLLFRVVAGPKLSPNSCFASNFDPIEQSQRIGFNAWVPVYKPRCAGPHSTKIAMTICRPQIHRVPRLHRSNFLSPIVVIFALSFSIKPANNAKSGAHSFIHAKNPGPKR